MVTWVHFYSEEDSVRRGREDVWGRLLFSGRQGRKRTKCVIMFIDLEKADDEKLVKRGL